MLRLKYHDVPMQSDCQISNNLNAPSNQLLKIISTAGGCTAMLCHKSIAHFNNIFMLCLELARFTYINRKLVDTK